MMHHTHRIVRAACWRMMGIAGASGRGSSIPGVYAGVRHGLEAAIDGSHEEPRERTAQAKARLRAVIRASREGRDGAADALATRFANAPDGSASPATVAGYLPLPGEPDVRGCLAVALRRGGRTLAPRTLPGHALAWAHWAPGDATGTDRYGLRAPLGDAVPLVVADRPTVLLVPALAADLSGRRLGQGGGYYDRLLATLPRWPQGPLRIAVVHDDEVLDVVPYDPHDAVVDVILTPLRWVPVPSTDEGEPERGSGDAGHDVEGDVRPGQAGAPAADQRVGLRGEGGEGRERAAEPDAQQGVPVLREPGRGQDAEQRRAGDVDDGGAQG
jgi:5-formyltetrahydrofolate cyclo-ligase